MYQFLASQIGTAACIGLLTIFYIVFLKRETFFRLNRYILLAILVISLIVPQLKLPVRNEALPTDPIEKISRTVSLASSSVNYHPTAAGTDKIRTETSYMNLAALIGILYLAGVILSLSLTLFGIFKILSLRRKAEVLYYNGKKLYAIDDKFSTFTFLGMIFIRKSVVDDECAPNIISHEMVHARQKHSLDILFFELIKAIQWFNPFVYLLGREMRAVHEYIADHATIIETKDRKEYMATLLNQALGAQMSGLANNFNGKTIMKRLKMMMKPKSPKSRVLRYAILIVPVITVVLIFACNRKLDYSEISNLSSIPEEINAKPDSFPMPLIDRLSYEKMLAKELKMPEEARKKNITAEVWLEFKVNPDSTISDVKVINAKTAKSPEWKKKIGYGLEEEAIRAFTAVAGKWRPAIKDGKAIPFHLTDHILFGSREKWDWYNSPSAKLQYDFYEDDESDNENCTTNAIQSRSDDLHYGIIFPHSKIQKYDGHPLSFLGTAQYKVILNNLKYTEEAYKNDAEGIVEVTFKIDGNGRPTDIRANNDIGYGLAREASRVIALLKGFEPNQKFDGKDYLTVPIMFSTNGNSMMKMSGYDKYRNY